MYPHLRCSSHICQVISQSDTGTLSVLCTHSSSDGSREHLISIQHIPYLYQSFPGVPELHTCATVIVHVPYGIAHVQDFRMSCSLGGVIATAPPWLQDINKPWTNVQRQYVLSGQVSGWKNPIYLEEWVITLNLKDIRKHVLGVINKVHWTCLCKQIYGKHSSFLLFGKFLS